LTPFDASRYVDPDRGLCALRLGGWLPQNLVDHREAELQREKAEGERVAYVAATRARDLLVVPAVGDEPYAEGWVAPLNHAIYPPEGARRVQAVAPGCPVFTSRDSVRRRPDGDPASGRTVCPGLHTLSEADGEHSVVWWSPEREALSLDVPASFGLRRDDLIVKDVPAGVLKRYRDDYDAWRRGRDEAIVRASRPSLEVRTVSEFVRRPYAEHSEHVGRVLPFGPAGSEDHAAADAVDIVTIEPAPGRPVGRRYGTLVHATLAAVALDADDETIGRMAGTQARIAAAPPSELSSAIDAVIAALRHPLIDAARRAAGEGRCLREMPVTVVRGGTLVEGVIDLAFETDDGMIVVDFKTDRAEGEVLATYRRQVALYADAIAQVTGRPVRALLMEI
jgi:hypothetical protein